MYCAYHADRSVAGICSKCGRPICEDCRTEVEGQVYCRPCAEPEAKQSGTGAAQPEKGRPLRENVGLLRFLLSLAPGLGHLYLGLFNRGLQLMGGAILGAFVLGMLLPNTPLPFFFVCATIAFSVFDAREAHLRMEQGLEVEDKEFVDLRKLKAQWDNRYVGYILIALGVLFLYNTFLDLLPYEIRQAARGFSLGLLALGAGVWMLLRDRKTSG